MTGRKIVLVSSLCVLGLIVTATIVHEVAHVVAALVIGVPFSEIGIGLYGINPSVTIPERFAGSNLAIYHYAGGLTAALILIIVYLLYWHRRFRREPSLMTWLLGGFTIMAAGTQLAQGYNEGRFHAAYIHYAGSLFNILQINIFALVIIAILAHIILCPVSKVKRA